MPVMKDAQHSSRSTLEFAAHAREAIRMLQSASAAIVTGIPGSRVTRPNQLSRILLIDKTLAWKMSKLLETTDPFEAGQYLPGLGGINIFIEAAARKRVPIEALEDAKEACQRLGELIRVHAGDRKTFDALLASQVKDEPTQAEIEHRKMAFQGNSYLFGIQCKVRLASFILWPSQLPDLLDVTLIRGFIDIKRFRPDVTWRIHKAGSVDETGSLSTDFHSEALDPAIRSEERDRHPPFMTEFCTKPLPGFRSDERKDGLVEYRLVEGAVGNTGRTTCLFGEITRGPEPRYRTASHPVNSVAVRLRMPCEILVLDAFIHRDLFGDRVPELNCFNELFAGQILAKGQECDRMEIHEKVRRPGTGADNLRIPEIPRYPDMIHYAFDRIGEESAKFNLFRVRIRFPPIPAVYLLEQELPERPDHRTT